MSEIKAPTAWLLTDLESGHKVATHAEYTLNFYRAKGWKVTPLYTAQLSTPVNSVTGGKQLTITLPDTSTKAFWSGTGKNETFHPETYMAVEIERLRDNLKREEEGRLHMMGVADTFDWQRQRLHMAAKNVIKWLRQEAKDRYGDADKAENDACVRELRDALEFCNTNGGTTARPTPEAVPAKTIHDINVQGAFAMGIERYGDAMQELAKKEVK